ncbi:MAG: hypothetical protein U1A16_01575, partial [Patescibacteria group bacterium]|nr:hypothetical protein [Patescibacteria group bacterium]
MMRGFRQIASRVFVVLRRFGGRAVVATTTIALLFWSLFPYPLANIIPVARATVATPVQIQKVTTANPHGARVDTSVAVIGINATSSSATLTSIKVTLTDSGSSGFTPTSTLAGLTNNAFSGVAIYTDNGTANGQFDLSDSVVSTTTAPVVQGAGPWTVTWTLQNASVPADDTGASAGNDFFVVVRPREATEALGKKFTVSIAGNAAEVVASSGNVGQAGVTVASDPLVVVPNLV